MYETLFTSNERLNKIFKTFQEAKLGIPSYSDYNEDLKADKRQFDLDNILVDTENSIVSLQNKIESEIKELVPKISNIKHPNVLTNLEEAFKNALDTHQAKPKNIESILKLAIEQNRLEYVYYTLDFYLSDLEISADDKKNIRAISDELNKQYGIEELQSKKKTLESELLEVVKHLDLLRTKPAQFEADIKKITRTANRLYANGQLEAESILIS